MDFENTNQLALSLRHLDLEHVDALARRMVDALAPGIVFGLVGTLGAGKTRIVQSMAAATGVDPADVTSPTFTLLQTHHGSITLHHLDAYRVTDDDEFWSWASRNFLTIPRPGPWLSGPIAFAR